MAAWDRRTPKQLATAREAAVKAQVVDAVGPFSPFWRERLASLGRTPAQVGTVAGLTALPAVGERDVCPDGDPAGAGALVLQVTERGWALHADGPTLRKALVRRTLARRSYAALVEDDTRPTSYVPAGLGVRYPLASTRGDLDLVARAGARLWQVLGLTRADVLVAALAPMSSAAAQALQYAALGAGSPALLAGPEAGPVADALRLLPATVLALPVERAVELVEDLDDAGAELSGVRTVLLVGAPTDTQRADLAGLLAELGLGAAVVLAAHTPDGHRALWGECRESAGRTGLHTYPDLDLVELVDPETGEPVGKRDGGEVVLSQLGWRGSALLRWRTGDLAAAVDETPCPACGRTVPRVLGARRAALVPVLRLNDGPGAVDLRAVDLRAVDLRAVDLRAVDLRGVTGALAGRADLRDWRVVVGPSRRRGTDELLVYVVAATGTDEAEVGVGVALDVRAACGLLPTQVLVVAPGQLPTGPAGPCRRVLGRPAAG